MAQTMMIHTSKRWAHAVSANIWPYAVMMAADIMNNAPSTKPLLSVYNTFSSELANKLLLNVHRSNHNIAKARLYQEN